MCRWDIYTLCTSPYIYSWAAMPPLLPFNVLLHHIQIQSYGRWRKAWQKKWRSLFGNLMHSRGWHSFTRAGFSQRGVPAWQELWRGWCGESAECNSETRRNVCGCKKKVALFLDKRMVGAHVVWGKATLHPCQREKAVGSEERNGKRRGVEDGHRQIVATFRLRSKTASLRASAHAVRFIVLSQGHRDLRGWPEKRRWCLQHTAKGSTSSALYRQQILSGHYYSYIFVKKSFCMLSSSCQTREAGLKNAFQRCYTFFLRASLPQTDKEILPLEWLLIFKASAVQTVALKAALCCPLRGAMPGIRDVLTVV